MSIRVTSFSGINTMVAARLLPNNGAQHAHNCLLWDGALRPLAKWIKLEGVEYAARYSIDVLDDGKSVVTSSLKEVIFLDTDMYESGAQLGLTFVSAGNTSNLRYGKQGAPITDAKAIGVPKPELTSTLNYTPGFFSSTPVARVYAVSGVRKVGDMKQEGPIAVVPNQDSFRTDVFEGDVVAMDITVTAPDGMPYDFVRLYRAISEAETGKEEINEFNTSWHLVKELSNTPIVYNDDGLSAPLDLYLAGNFYPPPTLAFFKLGETEQGNFVAITVDGRIAVSERYLFHAWPMENRFDVFTEVTDAVVQHNNMYIGTTKNPMVMAISDGKELSVQGNIVTYKESYPCKSGSMDKTPSGAIYASDAGVVALDKEGMQLFAGGVESGPNPLYKIEYKQTELVGSEYKIITYKTPMRFSHTTYGAYYRGTYIGFCLIPANFLTPEGDTLYFSKAYMLNTGSSLDGTKPLQRLITCDSPTNVRQHAKASNGVYVLADDGVWRMPFPDSGQNSSGLNDYVESDKMCYRWKSKKFVMRGETVMGACKVVHDCGPVRIKIYADCCCVYETTVSDCKPFTLPLNVVGTEFEFELIGSATVHEVHIAQSIKDLLRG